MSIAFAYFFIILLLYLKESATNLKKREKSTWQGGVGVVIYDLLRRRVYIFCQEYKKSAWQETRSCGTMKIHREVGTDLEN